MDIIQFFKDAGVLKDLPRTGWVKRQIPNPETVAAHSWRATMIAIWLAEREGADASKCALMMTCHDFPEADPSVGDITPSCNISKEDKAAMECNASEGFSVLAGTSIFHDAFLEYEAKETLEAKVCNDADKLECIFTAIEYNQKYPDIPANFEGFLKGSEGKVLTTTGKQLFEDLKQNYSAVKAKIALSIKA